MRKSISLAAAVALAAALPVLAGQQQKQAGSGEKSAMPHAHGTVTSWDEGSHTFRVHQPDGSESVFHWSARTQMRGTPKVGEMVKLEYERDASGNAMATRIAVPKEKDASARQQHHPSSTTKS